MPPQQGLLAGFATGLLSLKAHVRNCLNIPVEVLDLSSSDPEEWQLELQRVARTLTGAAIFGITTTTASYLAALEVAAELKRLRGDDAVVIFGGHHASADPDTILVRHPDLVDFIIAGEGEVPLVEFLEKWPAVDGVSGLYKLSLDGQVCRNPPPPPLGQDVLDTLTMDPHWFGVMHEPGKFDRYTYVSARGCPLRCRFCSVANSVIRGKSATVVAKEIARIVHAGYRRIAIEDNFFAHSPSRTQEICKALGELRRDGLEFSWDCQTRVEAISRPGVARLMKDAGCDEIYLGVEALDSEALEFLGKAPNPERYFKLFRDVAIPELLSQGLGININLQCGLPEEAKLSAHRSLARLREAGELAALQGGSIQVFPQLFVIYPGTAHFAEFCARQIIWPQVFEPFVQWEKQNTEFLEWQGCNFAHGIGGIPLGILDRASLVDRRFVVDWRLARAAQRFREDMASLPGISVFEYASHLVPRSSALQAARGGLR